jgi:hypothetical protein
MDDVGEGAIQWFRIIESYPQIQTDRKYGLKRRA